MSAATALVPAICWREPLRTISAAQITVSSVARAMAAADAAPDRPPPATHLRPGHAACEVHAGRRRQGGQWQNNVEIPPEC